MANPIRRLSERLRSSQPKPATPAGPADVGTGGDLEWPQHVASSGLRVQPLTAVLGVALIATLAVWGGAELQKRHGGGATASPSAAFSGFPSRTGGATGSGGFGAAGGIAVGTVTVISGKTLYLTSSSGAIVKVKLTSKTTYTRTAKTASTGLKPGDTAIVQGAKNAAGVTVATSDTATAKGVTPRGFGGGFGATPGASSAGG